MAAPDGDRDFMRPVTQAVYGVPSERVIGSSNALRYEPGEHDDPERSLEQAEAQGWTVVSIRRDWATVFG